jgi:hypothetical protein
MAFLFKKAVEILYVKSRFFTSKESALCLDSLTVLLAKVRGFVNVAWEMALAMLPIPIYLKVTMFDVNCALI